MCVSTKAPTFFTNCDGQFNFEEDENIIMKII